MEYKNLIRRKEDGYHIKSNNIDLLDIGIWINDDLETGDKLIASFIPWNNILQIVKYFDNDED